MFDVFWGRRSKIHHGIKDGGAKAGTIGNTDIALEHNGNTIFNVNHPDNECLGGHYHDPTTVPDPTEACVEFDITDWNDNKIIVLATGIPNIGEVGPHGQTNTCMMIQVYKSIGVPSIGSFKEVLLDIIIDSSTRDVILRKSALAPKFSGKVILDAK